MESVATTAVWLAIRAIGIASGLYLTHLLGLRLVMRRLTTDAGEGRMVASIERDNNGWTASLWATREHGRMAGACLAGRIAGRAWQAVDHAPWSNMYEFTIAFATGILGFYLVFERVYATRTEQSVNADVRTRSTRTLGAVALPVVCAMLVISVAFFPDDVRPLVPALQNTDLLAIHVASMILAYAALSVSFAAAVLYLIQGGEQNRFRRLPRAGDTGRDRIQVGHGRFPVARGRHRARGVLGELSVGPLLGLGSEGDVGARDVAYLRNLPAHPQPAQLVRDALGRGACGRLPRGDVHILRGEPVGVRAAQLRGRLTAFADGPPELAIRPQEAL